MQINLIVSVTILSRKKAAPTYSPTNIPRSTHIPRSRKSTEIFLVERAIGGALPF